MSTSPGSPSHRTNEKEQAAAFQLLLEQERSAHAATKQKLVVLEEAYGETSAAHAALQDSYNDLLQSSQQQSSAYKELEKAHTDLHQELVEAKAAAAEAHAEVLRSASPASQEAGAAAVTASHDEANRGPPSLRELHKTASLRLHELQHERDSLAAQLAALTAKAGARLSRSVSSRETSTGGSNATGSSGGASSSQLVAAEIGSGVATPSSRPASSGGASELELSGTNHLADLLEGLQQLHVLTEDMVEAAEQVGVLQEHVCCCFSGSSDSTVDWSPSISSWASVLRARVLLPFYSPLSGDAPAKHTSVCKSNPLCASMCRFHYVPTWDPRRDVGIYTAIERCPC